MALCAQRLAMPMIGFLGGASFEGLLPSIVATFRRVLSEAGSVEGKDVVIKSSSAERRANRLPALAAAHKHSVKVVLWWLR